MKIQWLIQVLIAIFLFAPVVTVVFSPEKNIDQIELSGEFDDDTSENTEFDELNKIGKFLKLGKLQFLFSPNLVFPEIRFAVLQNYHGDVPTPPPDQFWVG